MSVEGRKAPDPLRDPRFPAGPFFPLDESKLHPPWARPGIVPRTALVERLLAPPATPVICVIAPPGYGKTTVLAQWAERNGRIAWVGIDRRDNDPMVLLTYVAAALDRVEAIDPEIVRALASPGALPVTVVRRLAAALEGMSEPVVLILDNLESLEERSSLDVVAALAMQFSSRPVAGSQLVLASRSTPPLPMGRLRALGSVQEVRVEELAMDERESRALLEGAGVRLAEAEATTLIRRTEGWPVGLYLAALSLQAGSPRSTEGVGFSGDDRFLADYLWSELLAQLPPETVSFLMRTAVLERMCGPLCDAVLDTGGSGAVLESLAESNLLLVPLDRHREWYRYHHLFGDLLAAELVRREPELVPELHRRAAVWCEGNGLPEAAVDHARAADDTDRVARLVAGLIQPTAAAGRVDTVRSWLEWFEDRKLIDGYPAVAVLGAMMHALWGQPATAERWADAAAGGSLAGTLPDGSTMQSYWSLLQALFCRDGVDRMRADVQANLAGLSPGGQLRTIALLLEGISYLLEGDDERADLILIGTIEAGTQAGALPAVSIALAERCLIAIERDHWDEAAILADQAHTIVQRRHLEDYVPIAVVYAVLARTAAHQGEAQRAQAYLARAARLRPHLTYATPQLAVQALLELGRAYLALGDRAGATEILREARDILRWRPDLGILHNQADKLRSQLDAIHGRVIGSSSLTRAELRLLPLLSTHFTFREIGERLFVSQNTVKRQAISIYQKLGVSSRSQAVRRAQELGIGG